MKENTISFDTIISSIEKNIEKYILSGSFWKWKALFLTVGITITFYILLNTTPFYQRYKGFYLHAKGVSHTELVKQGYNWYYWYFFQDLAKEPLKKRNIGYQYHECNMVYRLAVPMLARITGLNTFGLFGVQWLLGFAQIFALISLIYSLTRSRLNAFYFALGACGIYYGNGFLYDVTGFTDSWVFCLITLAIYTRNPLLIFLFTQIAFWTDERGLINSSYVFLWWLFIESYTFDFKKALQNKQLWALVASWVVYLVGRFTIMSLYHLEIPLEEGSATGFVVMKEMFGWFNSSIWRGYEAFVILPILGFYLLYKKQNYIALGLILISFIITMVVTFMTLDTMRTMSYGGLIFVIFIRLFKDNFSEKELRYFLAFLAIINIISPSFY
ncbi:hypothetical protein GCM10011514_33810 [Emticicia aquatilis]|uniref:Uncharacterized protein n=1 Tax=Emticicia aquatilis TaxID=1537369 RepID=A0A917DTC3_9BACT|nr:hypothetical protein [Emticicia aquatilis]GGD66969.1 hypothetical protein GCM10011514_33810 [Emticicia aquatilis]